MQQLKSAACDEELGCALSMGGGGLVREGGYGGVDGLLAIRAEYLDEEVTGGRAMCAEWELTATAHGGEERSFCTCCATCCGIFQHGNGGVDSGVSR